MKRSVIAMIIALGLLLIAIFGQGLYAKTESKPQQDESKTLVNPDQPTLVSTTPSPLDKAILLPGQDIVLVFSHPLENIPELKHTFEPAIDGLESRLSPDKKTVTFSTKNPLPVGHEYKLTIQQQAKFQGGKNLDKQYDFQFKTIDYKGV